VLVPLASSPAEAFGLRLGPFPVGLPFRHGHHHRHLYMHGNSSDAARRRDSQSPPGPAPRAHLALYHPGRALSPRFQHVFWPAFSSPWPFSYDAIFTTAFATPGAERSREDCAQSLDPNAIVERLRAAVGPNAEQMERLQRLGGAIGAAAGYLAKSCPTQIPAQPIARLQLMDSQIQVLTMAVDIIHQPLREFEQSLTDEQRARLSGEPATRKGRKSARSNQAAIRSCGASAAAIDWS